MTGFIDWNRPYMARNRLLHKEVRVLRSSRHSTASLFRGNPEDERKAAV
jgi:hypothetical protein